MLASFPDGAKRSLEYRMQRGASGIGLPIETYRARVEAGQKWCCGCKDWHPRESFGVRSDSLDGLMRVCREANNARAREGMRRLAARRRETAS